MSLLKNQAIQHALTGDWKEAIETNKSLLEKDPNDTEALNRMALAYTVLGKNQEAKKTYEKVLKIDALNPIALKNIKKIKNDGNSEDLEHLILGKNSFIEEVGKTKIVELVNVGQVRIISKLKTGQSLNLCIKRLKIFVQTQNEEYLGVLPDDIARRLIKFIKGGNRYEAFVKSAESNRLIIFIREVKRSSRFKDQPSFLLNPEKTLTIKKNVKKNGDAKEDDA